MHGADDEAVAERPHGVGQDIAGNRLDNVLGDFGTVGLEPGPLAEIRPLIGHAVGAEAIHADAGLDVGEPAAGGQIDEEHAAGIGKDEAVGADLRLIGDRLLDGGIDIPPEADDMRIRIPPGGDQRLQLVLGKAHLEGAHRLQRPDAAAVAEGQLSDLALLPEVGVDAVLLDRNVEHHGSRAAVNVLPLAEDIHAPLLPCQMRQDSGLDGGEVGDDILVPGARDEGRAD